MAENRILTGLLNFYRVFKWLEAVVCLWFLRLFTPFCIAWGLWDLWCWYEGDRSQQRADDAAIRTFAGILLALCWLFLARREGPWTLNKNGIMERWPLAKKSAASPAAAVATKPYQSPSVSKYD
jgi:hypothetical protein